jgi:hypothetical protein
MLNDKLKEHKSAKVKLLQIIRGIDKEIASNNLSLTEIFTEQIRRKEIEDIKSIEKYELLSEDEMIIIHKNMNKTYGVTDRFVDLERICKEVIDIKNIYPKWKLINLKIYQQEDLLLPYSHYNYEYKDATGNSFEIRK